ncbi:phosphotransferase family protein [Streptomyces sp. NPDC091292]|uniref:phosphotransferase family protein n=1 Tax=Streptomyces sp. NPDC091292 TaxID=3365991 RepID=UPI0038196743
MGAPPVPRLLNGECAPDAVYDEFVKLARKLGTVHQGHHNQNHVLGLTEPMAGRLGREPGTLVTVRSRMADALPVVIRTWQDESEILRAVEGVLPNVPSCLAVLGDTAVHSYVDGVPLSGVCPDDKHVDLLVVQALAEVFGEMTRVRRAALPRLPADWPTDHTDSQGYLRTLCHLAERQIRQPNWTEFGGLFAELGIPDDAMERLAERVPVMRRRPFSLLHTDLHRDNVIMSYHGDPPMICVDWELASYGDPLHDLATHLVRMRYPDDQWDEVIDAWADAMRRFRPAALQGLGDDLRHYVSFERAQSVYPDVMRAANSLERSYDQRSLDAATRAVRRALEAAAEPLDLRDLPDEREIERILFRRRAVRHGRDGSTGTVTAIHWVPDERVPEQPDFPRTAVHEALIAESAAREGRVFEGTAHLNSVVRVSGVPFPVVVRRKAASVPRRERVFLSEHAVLAAIEEAQPPAGSDAPRVRAPRVVALGTSSRRVPFAIHTYVGPPNSDQPPHHPVDGLLPHEADDLVDQLGALTRVDHRRLDPAADTLDFYDWLTRELVRLVEALPAESLRFATVLGLPRGLRLREILSRHRVVPRAPALLHGDLNPWNLVRGENGAGLTVIDWEMAMIGDPLYDLVRHMHLTPTPPEIRKRMFDRWEKQLPATHTKGWREDWHVYRQIEIVRSAYVDLDRLMTRTGLDAPNVCRAVDSYAVTLATAAGCLGLRPESFANPYLARALPNRDPAELAELFDLVDGIDGIDAIDAIDAIDVVDVPGS